jgi:hypothetical protein
MLKKSSTSSAILKIAKNKAEQSICRYKISALGFNNKGELVASTVNSPRFCRKGGGVHAELRLMKEHKGLKTILICRVGGSGDLLPIDPCVVCAKKAFELGIKIITINKQPKKE